MKNILVILILLTFGCGTALEGDSACESDRDCKGDRVCNSGECVDLNDGGDSQNNVNSDSDSNQTLEPGAFGAQCQEDNECDEDLCVRRFAGDTYGFCTTACDAVSECPTNYDCVVINNAARKSCVPEDRLDECKGACDDYGFFNCVDSEVVTQCQLACEEASVADRLAFSDCAGSETLGCSGTSCLSRLGISDTDQPADDCRQDAEVTGYCGGNPYQGMVCENDASLNDSDCELMGVEGSTSYYCCFTG